MGSREHGSQAASHRHLPGLCFAHQPSPIHLHQGVQPGAIVVVELAFATLGKEPAHLFLLLGGHLHVTQGEYFFIREGFNGHFRHDLINPVD